MRPTARFGLVILALTSFVLTGIFGYMGIEGWSFLESLYMTILTFTTVGYLESTCWLSDAPGRSSYTRTRTRPAFPATP